MWPVIGAALVGAWFVKRQAPKTKVTKSQVTGGRSGRVWAVEYFNELGVMVVHGRGAKVAFHQTEGGWKAERGGGNPDEIAVIRKDFEGE